MVPVAAKSPRLATPESLKLPTMKFTSESLGLASLVGLAGLEKLSCCFCSFSSCLFRGEEVQEGIGNIASVVHVLQQEPSAALDFLMALTCSSFKWPMS